MKSKFRFILPVIMACFSLSACDWIQISDSGKEEKEVASGYYADYNLKLKGTRLVHELQTMCFAKHTQWVTYGQVNGYYNKTDDYNSAEAIGDGSNKNQWFYTGKETSAVGDREHVWPCAKSGNLWVHSEESGATHYVDNKSYIGGGSDLYHVRTCNHTVNQYRGDSKFVDFDDTEYTASDLEEIGDGGPYKLKTYGCHQTNNGYGFASYSEPADEMKGDIARIILYVWVHYTERGITPTGSKKSGSITYKYSDMTGGLNLTSVMGYDSDAKARAKLKEWNEIDPPSEVEKLRNNTVQKIQGNRNPFVDYPELVNQMFN